MRPESALAAAEVGGRSLYEWFGFWAPGAVVAMLLSAWLFREQFAELHRRFPGEHSIVGFKSVASTNFATPAASLPAA